MLPSFIFVNLNFLQACKRVANGLVEASSQRRPLEKNGVFTAELVRYSKNFRGECCALIAPCRPQRFSQELRFPLSFSRYFSPRTNR